MAKKSDEVNHALRPLVRPRLYEQLMARLLEHIQEAGLRVGDRLPSERTLAEHLNVSRNSLKQATVALEVQGIVETRHGGGTYLLAPARAPESINELIDRRHRLPEILEAREALEIKIAELAAERRTEADLAALACAVAEMRAAVAAGELGDEADRKFHAAIVAAAKNSTLASFYGQIEAGIRESRIESLRQPGRPARSLEQHVSIFAAIEANDRARAAKAARQHVRAVGKVRLLAWDPEAGSSD